MTEEQDKQLWFKVWKAHTLPEGEEKHALRAEVKAMPEDERKEFSRRFAVMQQNRANKYKREIKT